MKRRDFLALSCAAIALSAWPRSPAAQQVSGTPRVAFLHEGATQAQIDNFLRGMRDGGYVSGKDFVFQIFEARTSDEYARVAAAAVGSNPDVLVAQGDTAYAAHAQTSTIPIVFIDAVAPVERGLVQGSDQPGSNSTGLEDAQPYGELLTLLRDIDPPMRQVALFIQPGDRLPELLLPRVSDAAKGLGIEIVRVDVLPSADLDGVFARAQQDGLQGAMSLANAPFLPRQQQFADLALKHHIALAMGDRDWVTAGGLLSYTAKVDDYQYRAAKFVIEIIGGAKAADLPIEGPDAYDLYLNAKTAMALGLTIPQSILYDATDVIR